jgi:hypothetical protein
MFSRKSNMLIHARQHSESKRHTAAATEGNEEQSLAKPSLFFHCAHCGVNFDNKSALKAHVCHGHSSPAVVSDDGALKSGVEVYYAKNDDNIYLTVPILLQ